MNKATIIQTEWIELGFEPLSWDKNGYIDYDSLPEDFDLAVLEIKIVGDVIIVRPKALKTLTKKIYIAGKVTGLPITECTMKFGTAQKEIEALGFETVNPIEVVADFNAPWKEAMKKCITALMDCDAVYLVSDWYDSKGAKLEVEIASKMDITILKSLKALEQWSNSQPTEPKAKQ